MSMKSINFNTGIKKYSLNGDENNCIEVNVNDPNIVARITKLEDDIAAEFDKLDRFLEMSTEERSEIDQHLKDMIDEAFNADISSHVFGATNCLTPLMNGDLLIQSFIDAFFPVVLADASKIMNSFAKNSAKKAEQYIKNAEGVEDGEAK